MSRRTASRVVAGLAAAWWAVPFFGLVDLAVPLLRTPGFEQAYLLETGWGLLYTVLVAVPLVALAVRPDAWAPALQLAVVSGALAVTAVVTPAIAQLWPAAGVLGSAVAVRGLACGRPVPRRRGVGRPEATARVPLALLVMATVPALLHAADMVVAARERRPPIDITNGLDHWPTQAALGPAVVAVGAVALGRPGGGRIPTWCAGVAATWLGALSVAYPDHAGSLGRLLGVAAVLWGVAFVVVVARTRPGGRRPAASAPAAPSRPP